jgi:hypothetical protein
MRQLRRKEQPEADSEGRSGAGRVVTSIRGCGWPSHNFLVALALLLAELPWHTSGFAVPNTTSNQICTFDFECTLLGEFSHPWPSLCRTHYIIHPSYTPSRHAARRRNFKAPPERAKDSTLADIAGDAQGTNASRRCIRTGTCCRRKRCAAALLLATAPQTARPSVAEALPTRATRAGNASTRQGSANARKGGSARDAATIAQPLGGLSAPTSPHALSTQRAPRPSAIAQATGGARRVRLSALAGRRVRARGTDSARTMGSACATGHIEVKRAMYLALA